MLRDFTRWLYHSWQCIHIMEKRAVNLHICRFEIWVFCVSVLSRWEKTRFCLIGSLIKRRLVCFITGFALHLALEFSMHMTNILLRFLNQLRRQIRSTSSGRSIFLSLSKRRKRLCLQFIRGPWNFDKMIIYYFVYIWSSIWRRHPLKHFIRAATENLWPCMYFVLPDIFREKSRYFCNFQYIQVLFLLPQIPPGTFCIALFQFRDQSIILKHFTY